MLFDDFHCLLCEDFVQYTLPLLQSSRSIRQLCPTCLLVIDRNANNEDIISVKEKMEKMMLKKAEEAFHVPLTKMSAKNQALAFHSAMEEIANKWSFKYIENDDHTPDEESLNHEKSTKVSPDLSQGSGPLTAEEIHAISEAHGEAYKKVLAEHGGKWPYQYNNEEYLS